MPSLVHRGQGFPENGFPVSALSARGEFALSHSGEDAASCLCGSRLPLQVRLGLRSRTRPVLEGRWCCSERCLTARVTSFVRRGLPKHSLQKEHRHRVPLDLLLLSSHAISRTQLTHARGIAETTGERIGDILVRDCGLSERRLAQGLAAQWGCSAWDVRGNIAKGMACVAPGAVLRRTSMLPLREFSDGQLGVAFPGAPDAQAVFALRRMHDRAVEAGVAPPTDFAAAQERLLRQHGVAAEELHCDSDRELIREMTRILQKQQPVESRWVRVHGMFWLRLWLEPAALAGGPTQAEDVVDYIFHMNPAAVGTSAAG